MIQEEWTYPPFAAHMDEKGNIYARGAQDDKSLGIQYLEAIRRLKSKGMKLKRTIHVLFVPDEEVGGILGMKKFVYTPEFKNLNIGFALSEGDPTSENELLIFNQGRTRWLIWIICKGKTGHSLNLLDDTAGEKLTYIVNKFMSFRAQEKARLKNQKLQLGHVTTINLVKIEVLE